jgi:hypothetical protein
MDELKFYHAIGGKTVIVHPPDCIRAGVEDVNHNFKVE